MSSVTKHTSGEVFIEFLPETNHDEKFIKEELKQRCNKLGLDKKTTTVSQLEARESA